MWLMEKFISFVCDCFYNLCAALMNLMSAAMLNFIPNEGNYGVPNILTSSEGFGFDFFVNGYQIFLSLAFVLVFLKFTFNLLSDLKPGLSSARDEGLFTHIGRFILALALVGSSYKIIDYVMAWGYQLVLAGLFANEPPPDIGTSITTSVTSRVNEMSGLGSGLTKTAFVPLVIIIAITWNQLKLFVELAERFITTTLITMLAPLGFCTVVSQDWSPICKRYNQMVFSSYLVTLINVFFMRMSFQAMVFTMGTKEGVDSNWYTWRLLGVLAILIVAQKADRVVRDSGLAVSQTGGQLFGSLMAVMGGAVLAGRGLSRASKDMASRPAGRAFGRAGSGHVVSTGTGTAATSLMNNALGSTSAGSRLMTGGNFSFANQEASGIRIKDVDGMPVAEGTAQAKSGKFFNFETDPTGAGKVSKNHGVIETEGGVPIAVWGEGARDAMTPYGYSTLAADSNMVSGAEDSANSIISGGIQSDGHLSEETLSNAVGAAQSQLYAGSDVSEIRDSVNAGAAMIGQEELEGKTMVGAWHNTNEPEGLFHAMAIDNSNGEICTYDIASKSNADRMEGFGGMAPASTVQTDVGRMEVYKTVLTPSSADPSKYTITDMDNRKLELPKTDRIVATDIPGVYQRRSEVTYRETKTVNGKRETETKTKEVTSGHWVPASKYNVPKNSEFMKIEGQVYGFVPADTKNQLSGGRGDNSFINMVRSVFSWKK